MCSSWGWGVVVAHELGRRYAPRPGPRLAAPSTPAAAGSSAGPSDRPTHGLMRAMLVYHFVS